MTLVIYKDLSGQRLKKTSEWKCSTTTTRGAPARSYGGGGGTKILKGNQRNRK